ncbi:MAG: hypothetical protein R6U17_07260 [Thermoplasmata archaeon]
MNTDKVITCIFAVILLTGGLWLAEAVPGEDKGGRFGSSLQPRYS